MELLADIVLIVVGTILLTAYILGVKEGMDEDE